MLTDPGDDDDAPDDDDAMSSIYDSMSIRGGSSRTVESTEPVCRAQKFRLHEPVVEHHMATNDADDGIPQPDSGLEWWRGVEVLIDRDRRADASWWSEVEAAIKDEEVSEVLAVKRQHEHEATRADCSKRSRKPG